MATKKTASQGAGTGADNGKQAVLLIHGIGEQKPMETLRTFVKAVWTDDETVRTKYVPKEVWSKPDRVSRSFELRRLTSAQNRNRVRTDFFEFYWAHLMHGTTLTHVLGWARFLLARNPFTIPPALRGVYILLVVGLILVAVFALNAALPKEAQYLGALPAWLSAIISVALVPALGWVLKKVVGDAARYLYPAPTNIQRRHEIRTAGIQLIRNLHRRGYRRIIVVGHSLGSVIGYDILTHAFADFNAHHGQPDSPETKSLDALEALALKAKGGGRTGWSDVQKAQRAYLAEMAANGNTWRVTDFVTLGSPLAHAEVLLAKSDDELRSKQESRELPTCLPMLEKRTIRKVEHWRFSFDRSYEKPKGGRGKVRVPHHAAVFGPTRWSNLYFPVRNLLWGDFIAGPVAPIFGPGIRDEKVSTTQRGGLFSHTLYWNSPASEPAAPHILKLREVLDLADDRAA